MKYIFGLIGILTLWFSLSHISSTIKENDAAIKVQGTVIALSPVSSDNGVTYAPVVQYSASNGTQHYQFKSSSSANPPAYEVGEHINVAYAPQSPQNGYVDTWFSRWGMVFISGLIGAVFLLISGLMFKFRVKSRFSVSLSSGD